MHLEQNYNDKDQLEEKLQVLENLRHADKALLEKVEKELL